MTSVHKSSHNSFGRIARIFILFALLFMLNLHTSAQVSNITGKTPAGFAPGAPAGSYALSGFETVNLYSGNLNFSLPLLKVGGRGEAQMSMSLTLNNLRWHMEQAERGPLAGGGGGGYTEPPANWDTQMQAEATLALLEQLWRSWYIQNGFQAIPSYWPLPASPDLTPITNAGGSGGPMVMYPTPSWWGGLRVGYGPGVLQGRWMSKYGATLMRLTFTEPDGTEHELHDKLTGGKPMLHSGTTDLSRGTHYVSADGAAINFFSCAPDGTPIPVMEPARTRQTIYYYPSGFLTTDDGTRYRIDNGLVSWMSDRNGNTLTYTYGTNAQHYASYNNLIKVTDSLGREITVTYDNIPNPSTPTITYDEITYKTGDGVSDKRAIKIWRKPLHELKRQDYPQGPITFAQLFPEIATTETIQAFEESFVSAVELPNNQRYEFRYNPYGELARVVVPTGGAIEYDYNRLDLNSQPWSGLIDPLTIYRRVTERRTFADGTRLSSRQVYKPDYSGNGSEAQPWRTNVTVEQYAYALAHNNNLMEELVSYDKHYFYGYPVASLAPRVNSPYYFYSDWREGLEEKTESFQIVGSGATTPLRRIIQEWEPRTVETWTTQYATDQAAPKAAQLRSTTTELLDINPKLVARQVFGYDGTRFNNRTDVWEYSYGEGAASTQPLRHVQTTYLITEDAPPTPSPTPSPSASPSPSPTPTPPDPPDYPCPQCGCPTCRFSEANAAGPGVQEYLKQNLIRLPVEVRIYGYVAGQEQLQARSENIYDETALLARAGIVGWNNPGTLARGNATTARKWINPLDDNAFIKLLARFDAAGNVIETTDANNAAAANPKVTSFNYEDCFGSADGNARNCTSRQTFALPTSVTNTLGQTAFSKFDFYSGALVTTEDPNGIKVNMFYGDALGRLTQVVEAAGTPLQRQTTFTYNDLARRITTTSDQNIYGDNKLKSETLYDMLGRTVETHLYEGGGSFVTTRQVYDGLGRIVKSTNPYRTTNDSTFNETETKFDAIGRVVEIKTTSDGAKILSEYSGNTVTVTDQAGRQKKSVTDALGRLVKIFEAPNTPGYNFETRYAYDALDNLITVTQGPQDSVNDQTRIFSYDGLSRLKTATNPESGTITYDEYDDNGNLKKRTDARGIVANYFFDALNRPTRRTYSDSTAEVNYFYDAQALPAGSPVLERGASIGQVLAVTYGGANSINGTFYGYDNIGRATKSAQVTDGQAFPTMEYGYTLSGKLNWQRLSSGREIAVSYSDSGRLQTVSGQKSGETAKTYLSLPEYSAHGAMTACKLGNDLWERTNFNARLQITEIKLGTQSNAESVLKLQYSYGQSENNGNLLSQTLTVPTISAANGFVATQSFDYDTLNRLQRAQENSGANWRQTFTYDRFGNRRLDYASQGTTTPSSSLALTNEAVYNPQVNAATNRLLGHAYDATGNLTQDASGRTFTYDAENHQINYNGGASINNGNSATYLYDGEGRRVKKQVGGSMTSTVFVYDLSGQLAAEYTDAPEPHAAQTNYLTSDMLGSTRVVTTQEQQVKSRFDYLPFGEETSAGPRSAAQGYMVGSNVLQKFTGYERDHETGLDFAQARYYVPAHGRFTSADPILITPHRQLEPQTFNLYQYTQNPFSFTDPTGMELVRLGRNTDEKINKRVGQIDTALQKEGLTQKQKDKLEKERATLLLEQEGNKLVSAYLDKLKEQGLNKGLKLSDFTYSTDTVSDARGLLNEKGIKGKRAEKILEPISDPRTAAYVLKGVSTQIFILQSHTMHQAFLAGGLDTGFGRVGADDLAIAGATILYHEKQHRDNEATERVAYRRQRKILDRFGAGAFANKAFYNWFREQLVDKK